MPPERRTVKDIAKDYQDTFGGEGAGVRVLTDLADFCHVFKTILPPGSTVEQATMMEGRRQVYLAIQDYLTLDLSEGDGAPQAILEET